MGAKNLRDHILSAVLAGVERRIVSVRPQQNPGLGRPAHPLMVDAHRRREGCRIEELVRRLEEDLGVGRRADLRPGGLHEVERDIAEVHELQVLNVEDQPTVRRRGQRLAQLPRVLIHPSSSVDRRLQIPALPIFRVEHVVRPHEEALRLDLLRVHARHRSPDLL